MTYSRVKVSDLKHRDTGFYTDPMTKERMIAMVDVYKTNLMVWGLNQKPPMTRENCGYVPCDGDTELEMHIGDESWQG